jgi:hypothetical protein
VKNAPGLRRSLGRTGSCFDNAVAESFFATCKKELVHTRPWPTLAGFRAETFDWIEHCYKTRRRHSSLNYSTSQEHSPGCRKSVRSRLDPVSTKPGITPQCCRADQAQSEISCTAASARTSRTA